jgi:UDP-4-amino-4,6-dideoxy-N-acetyl-beta-L-altrosamine transaminase
MIPYGKQSITQDDIDKVISVLNSDFITQGPIIDQFEAYISSYCKTKYAIAVNSATSALHLACVSLGVSAGDIVWTSAISFVASANCALYCGAVIDFVDIDLTTYNLDVNALETKLIQARKINKLPKIIIPVHLCGQSCDMERIQKLSFEYGFKIIEDASHAIGGKYKNSPVGSCTFSDIVVFSFHPVKIITTGEGGMLLTNNSYLAERIRLLRSHGITRDKNLFEHESDAPWYYEQVELGYNYRMTDIHAALGLNQAKRLEVFVKKRHELAEQYDKLLEDLPIFRPIRACYSYSSFHLYVILINQNIIKTSHIDIFKYLRKKQIGVNLHYIPIYKHPFFKNYGFTIGYCPNAEIYYSSAISLPIFYDLTFGDQAYIADQLKRSFDF